MRTPANNERLNVYAPRVARMWRTRRADYAIQVNDTFSVRPAFIGDAPDIARLCHRAFLGTQDDDTAENFLSKVTGIFSGKYGPFIETASFVHDSDSGKVDAAVLVTDYVPYGCPVIALVVVGVDVQRRGIGTALVSRSLATLAQLGKAACCARITSGNERSEQFFRVCGFIPARE